jgi:methionine-rich copper-binding protein CopC
MKLLTTVIFASMMAVGTAACAKEEPKKPAVVAAAPAPAAPADAKKAEAPKTKQVCLDVQGKDGKPVIDPKTKKPKQNCTTVKVREKFEGTKIEDAKKK